MIAANSAKLYGDIGRQLGWPNAERIHREGQLFLSKIQLQTVKQSDRKETLSLADRFDTIVDVGRQIAGALQEKTIHQKVHEAATRLLRCESCVILEVNGSDVEKLYGDTGNNIRHDVVQRAIRQSQPVTNSLEDPQETGGQGTGSLLCTPVFAQGRLCAIIYANHSQIRDLFSENEIRLSQFIATLAGASLENALGYKQLQKLNATLEDRIAERTLAAESRARELAQSNSELEKTAIDLRRTEEQLRHAVDEANAANESKSRFLATMSHEIRTPMNGILGMAELALGTELDPTQTKYLRVVKQSGNTLLSLLNEILDLSKIEAGKIDIETIEFELREVIEDVTQLFSPAAHAKDLEIFCDIHPELPRTIQGDPGRLRQIIVNLVGNAIKFTSVGEISGACHRRRGWTLAHCDT